MGRAGTVTTLVTRRHRELAEAIEGAARRGETLHAVQRAERGLAALAQTPQWAQLPRRRKARAGAAMCADWRTVLAARQPRIQAAAAP